MMNACGATKFASKLFVLLVASFLLAREAHALLEQSEQDALYNMNTVFAYGWTNATIQALCTEDDGVYPVAGDLSITCTTLGATQHVTAIMQYRTTATTSAAYPDISGFTYLQELSVSTDGSCQIVDFTGLTALPAVTAINLNLKPSYGASPLSTQLTFSSSSSLEKFTGDLLTTSAPSFSGLVHLQSLSVRIYADAVSGHISVPSNMLNGVANLTDLAFWTSSEDTSNFDSFPSLTANVHLTTLQISDSGLSSLGNTDFSSLTALTSLILSGNKLRQLPTSLSGATALQTLLVDNNLLNAASSLPDLRNTKIVTLDASSNSIATLPDAFCQLPLSANISIDLSDNPISSIPTCFGTIGNVGSLTMASTRVSTFPTGLLSSYVTSLEWTVNNVTMTLPSGVTSWNLAKWKDLKFLDISNLQLSAPFLNDLKGSINLRTLNLAGNALSGSIVDDFFVGMENLNSIDFDSNSLSGAFPSSVSSASSLQEIHANANSFVSLPDSIGQLADLYLLDLGNNALSSIPSDSVWSNMNLYTLILSNNRGLTGPLMSSWFTSSSLQVLYVDGCTFSGDLPVLNSTSLSEVHASNNILNGTISVPVDASSLTSLFFDQNRLQGSIPSELANSTILPNIAVYNMSFNRLTGTLPEGIESVGALRVLVINNNMLSGALPIFNSSGIGVFWASSNSFDICLVNPDFQASSSDLDTATCSVLNNLDSACGCPSYYTGSFCQADLSACPPTPPARGPAPVGSTNAHIPTLGLVLAALLFVTASAL